ncbi:hypothetical protein CEP52_004734 [Fusarium oligoseptatum]|uniref:Uncharacterized protein n=1 Tax=Fusarium oligoseptatum TaxID=2604345 RepID=A0A428U266_9HYPO|nr:hypothetical protein CEP52_004734 [Fusarium oligoseptatum]
MTGVDPDAIALLHAELRALTLRPRSTIGTERTLEVEFLICGQTCSCSIYHITTKNVPFNCRFPGDH